MLFKHRHSVPRQRIVRNLRSGGNSYLEKDALIWPSAFSLVSRIHKVYLGERGFVVSEKIKAMAHKKI